MYRLISHLGVGPLLEQRMVTCMFPDLPARFHFDYSDGKWLPWFLSECIDRGDGVPYVTEENDGEG